MALRTAIPSIVVAATAACSSGPDGPPETITITIARDGAFTVELFAFRDGVDAAWQPATALDDGRYQVVVHGPYTIEYVCAGGAGIATIEMARTPDDPHDIAAICGVTPFVPPERSDVQGTLSAPGSVALGTASAGAGNDGAYAFDVPDGTYDLVAQTAAAPVRLAIRRGVTVAGATRVPLVDFATEGVATLELPISVTGLVANEQYSAGVTLTTPSTFASLRFDPGAPTVLVVPGSALQPDDRQDILVGFDTAIGDRIIRRRVTSGVSTQFVAPPPYPIRYDVAGARATGRFRVDWDDLAPYEQLQIAASDARGGAAHRLDVSASYLATTGITGAAFDTDLPGYDAAWRIDYQQFWLVFGLVTTVGGDDADLITATGLSLSLPDTAP